MSRLECFERWLLLVVEMKTTLSLTCTFCPQTVCTDNQIFAHFAAFINGNYSGNQDSLIILKQQLLLTVNDS